MKGLSENTPKKKQRSTGARVALTTLKVIGKTVKWVFASVGTLLMIALVTGVMFALIFVVYCQNFLAEGQDISLDDFTLNETSFIYYYDKDTQDWEVMQELFLDNRVWVEYDELPEYVFESLVAIEDQRYWRHHGVDWYRTLGAAYTMFLGDGSSFGGSTITQQVVKNVTGNKEVTVRRKLTEIFSALALDKKYSKEDVLEVYINLVCFGQGCYGIQAAAQTYFGKDAKDLTLAEAASIVGITNLPTYYDPYQNREHNKERQENILWVMKEQGYIDEAEYQRTKNQRLVFKRDRPASTTTTTTTSKVQSYFCDQVIEDVIGDIMDKRGVSYAVAERYLFTGGYKIYTTMDPDVQAVIDEVYTNPELWPTLRDADTLEAPPQSAIVVMDPYTGNVLGMYGGLGEKTVNRARNRATAMTKQPGSSIKPIAVYSCAIEAGLIDPYDVFTDMPKIIDENGNGYPKNYDNIYRGQMTVMDAVGRSNNTIPVQLVTTMGPEHCFEFAKYKMGLRTLVEGEYRGDQFFTDQVTPSMALGGLTDGVTVLDMAAAYSVFPNAGVYNEPRTYTRVLDANGDVFIEKEQKSTAVIKERTAYYMNNLLTNVVANGSGVYARLSNSIAAGKTGTTDDDFDRWFCGYTPYYTCTVWYGFDYNHTINPTSGTSPAVPLWQQVMEKLHENLEPREFFTPATAEIVKVAYCRDSGMLATDACRADVRGSRVLTGTFLAEDVPTDVCSIHRFVDVCGESGKIATPACPEEGRRQVSMMQVNRSFPLPNIRVADEQYTIRAYGVDYSLPLGYDSGGEETTEPSAEPDENVMYRVAVNVADPANAFCTLHAPGEEPEDPNDDPNAGEFPTEPSDAPVSGEPASGEPSAPPPVSGEPSDAPPSGETTPSDTPGDAPPSDTPASPEFPTEPDDG